LSRKHFVGHFRQIGNSSRERTNRFVKEQWEVTVVIVVTALRETTVAKPALGVRAGHAPEI